MEIQTNPLDIVIWSTNNSQSLVLDLLIPNSLPFLKQPAQNFYDLCFSYVFNFFFEVYLNKSDVHII